MNTSPRLTLSVTHEMLSLVDDFWHSERLTSRNDAIRELLAYALDRKLGTAKPAKGSESRR